MWNTDTGTHLDSTRKIEGQNGCHIKMYHNNSSLMSKSHLFLLHYIAAIVSYRAKALGIKNTRIMKQNT